MFTAPLDPTGPMMPLGGAAFHDEQRRRRRQREESDKIDLTPEDEESLVKTVGRKALGGLAFVGDVLDTPGAIVRNTLAGRNPFSGFFSPEDRTSGHELLQSWGMADKESNWGNWLGGLATEIVTNPLTFLGSPGSALTKAGTVAKSAGLLDDLGGLAKASAKAAKVAAPGKRVSRMSHTLGELIDYGDPALRPARLQAAENAAKGMGLDLADIVDDRLGGLAKIKIPFGPEWTLGTSLGGTAEKVAKGLDTAGEALRYGNIPGTNFSPGRKVMANMDSSLFGTEVKEVQKHAPDLYKAQTASKVAANEATEPVVAFRKKHKLTGPTHNDDLWRLYETKNPVDLQQAVADISTKYNVPATEVLAHRQYARQLVDAMPGEAKEWGIRSPVLADPEAEYFPRSLASVSKDGVTYGVEGSADNLGRSGSRVFSAANEHQMHRKEFSTGIKGSTPTLKKIASDPDLIKLMDEQSGDVAAIAGLIKNKYGPAGTGEVPELYTKTLKGGGTKDANRYKALAKWMASFDRPTREAGIYGNDTVFELGRRVEHHADSIKTSKWLADTLADEWDTIASVPTRAARHPETKSLASVLKKLRLDAGDENAGFLKKLAERRGLPVNAQTIKDLGQWQIRTDVARDLTRAMKPFSSPEETKWITKNVTDPVTNYTKALLTGPWPAFSSRNLGSGQFRNATQGMFSPWSVGAAYDVARGKEVTGKALDRLSRAPLIQAEAAKLGLPLDGDSVAEIVSRLARRYGIVGRYQGEVAQRTGAMGNVLSTSFDDTLKGFPGGIAGRSASVRPGKIAQKYLGGFGKSGTTWNPLKGRVRGVFDSTETTLAPVAAGEDIGYAVELENRLSPWLDQISKGVDPMVAKRLVENAQVDYSARAFTPFERDKMTRLFPFYKFSSRQIPYTLRELWEHPGGKTATAIRITNEGRSKDPLVPDSVSETTAIPVPYDTPILGGGDPKTKRYITGFGLMHEDPMQFATASPSGLLFELLSRTNPLLVKAPIELAMGQSLYQREPEGGRPLEDMDPVLGRIGSNVGKYLGRESDEAMKTPRALEVLASNSPFSRILTTAKTLTDPRKSASEKFPMPGTAAAINLLTGARPSDVSPQARDAVLRKQLRQDMKEADARTFEKVSFAKEDLAKMKPDERLRALRMQALMDMLAKRAKQRREEKKRQKLSENSGPAMAGLLTY